MIVDICFEGVGQVAATFQVSGDGVLPGMAVTLGLPYAQKCDIIII